LKADGAATATCAVAVRLEEEVGGIRSEGGGGGGRDRGAASGRPCSAVGTLAGKAAPLELLSQSPPLLALSRLLWTCLLSRPGAGTAASRPSKGPRGGAMAAAAVAASREGRGVDRKWRSSALADWPFLTARPSFPNPPVPGSSPASRPSLRALWSAASAGICALRRNDLVRVAVFASSPSSPVGAAATATANAAAAAVALAAGGAAGSGHYDAVNVPVEFRRPRHQCCRGYGYPRLPTTRCRYRSPRSPRAAAATAADGGSGGGGRAGLYTPKKLALDGGLKLPVTLRHRFDLLPHLQVSGVQPGVAGEEAAVLLPQPRRLAGEPLSFLLAFPDQARQPLGFLLHFPNESVDADGGDRGETDDKGHILRRSSAVAAGGCLLTRWHYLRHYLRHE